MGEVGGGDSLECQQPYVVDHPAPCGRRFVPRTNPRSGRILPIKGRGKEGPDRAYAAYASVSWRSFSSCSLSSGVIRSPKSSAVKKGRISRSDGPGIGLGARLAHSIASSSDLTSHIQ